MAAFSFPKKAEGRRVGFTLIELLIVVAIIAILAAIAVPNFIEAQTRSKVSRVLNDLRTMRTAVESYSVDNSKNPRMSWGCYWGDYYGTPCEPIYGTLVGGPSVACTGQTANHLALGGGVTTPITYMTTLPTDPFGQGRQTSADAILYTYQDVDTHAALAAAGVICPASPGYVYLPSSPGARARFEERLGKYMLWSIGPAGTESINTSVDFFTQYDPTNGTSSNGRIFVSQKFFAPQYITPTGL